MATYEKKIWENSPSTNTPLNAENLNRMEEGIYNATEEVNKKMDAQNPTGTGSFSMNRKEGTTVGEYSTTEGCNNTASGDYSHAEGSPYFDYYGDWYFSEASGKGSHAEGCACEASGEGSHAEGRRSEASGTGSHAEGCACEASGTGSHAEGVSCEASGKGSHAGGEDSEASGDYSYAGGFKCMASNVASMAIGKFNKSMEDGGGCYDQIGDAFVIGNGSSSGHESNAIRVTYLGETYGLSAFNSSGADYAEFIKPWGDGNEEGEDRVGYFVTVKDGGIYKAEEGDYIVGITSGNPSIVGNGDEDYYWKYERDEFNRIVMEDIPEIVVEEDEYGNPIEKETGEIIEKARMKLAEDYDATLQYIPRKDRKEWDYVGMLGVLPVRDDGTCEVGKFCKCGNCGIATLAAERGFDTYMVIERASENVVKVVLK